MHLTECFSVPRLTLSGFLPSCNFHTQLLGFAFLNFPLDEDSFYFFQRLSLDMKNQLSPCLSQWGFPRQSSGWHRPGATQGTALLGQEGWWCCTLSITAQVHPTDLGSSWWWLAVHTWHSLRENSLFNWAILTFPAVTASSMLCIRHLPIYAPSSKASAARK